jgi:hypothetical protein
MQEIGNQTFFTAKFPLRLDMKNLNFVDISDVDIVLVSMF